MTHDERVRHHLYETCEGILEHAERIALLEELALHLRECMRHEWCDSCAYRNDHCDFDHDMRRLGLEEE